MFVYRIGSTAFITDLTGEGAFRYGGRWNRVGVRVLYTAEHIALSAWEYYVNIEPKTPPLTKLSQIIIEIPDSIPFCTLDSLPATWPARSNDLLIATDDWLTDGKFLAMKVPSAVIPTSYNYLLNPSHPQYGEIRIVSVAPFIYDPRSFR